MTYSELKTTIQDLHTGATLPNSIDNIAKLVLGKMARLRLKAVFRTAEITVGGNTEFLLSTYIPDFLSFKVDPNRKDTGPYFYQGTQPYFLTVVNKDRFVANTEGGFCCIDDGSLLINLPNGFTSPDTLYVPINSKYMVLDADDSVLKEKPTKDGDTFIFDSIFDDVFVDGVLLYVKRREMSDSEFTKASNVWNKAIKELAFYQ